MTRYAENTTVSSDKSRAEIEKTLSRYGAKGFLYGWQETSAVIAFQMNNRKVKFILPLPNRNDPEFKRTPGRGYARSPEARETAYEQAIRQKWRALALVIKAKLEAVESGITIFDDEFMAHIVLPNGETTGHWLRPQIERAYEKGTMPNFLPMLPQGEKSECTE